MKSLFREYNNIHKEQLKVLFHDNYHTHKQKIQSAFNKYYTENKEKIKAARKRYYGGRARNVCNAKSVLRRARRYYAKHRARCCANMRCRHDLTEPKPRVQHQYVQKLNKRLLSNPKIMALLMKAFKNTYNYGQIHV